MEDNNDNHPLDLSYLVAMVGDDPEFIIEILDAFIKETPVYLAEIKSALLNQDWKRLANYAHKIKPTLTYIGRSDVKDFIHCIETNSNKKENLSLIAGQVETLQLLLDKIYIQVRAAIFVVKSKI